jgi:hypothetical protein
MLQENMPERFEENLFGEIKLLLLLRLAQILRLVPEELSVQAAVLVDLQAWISGYQHVSMALPV